MVRDMATRAKKASRDFGQLGAGVRSKVLRKMGEELLANREEILRENRKDINRAKDMLDESRLSILSINEKDLYEMVGNLFRMASLPDPLGERISYRARKDGLIIERKYVPLGVIAVVYEARASVVTDAVGLAIRTGNSVILAGSRHSYHTDRAVVEILKGVLRDFSICPDNLQYLEDGSHDNKILLSQEERSVDLMIVRAGVQAVASLKRHSLLPLIIAGEGNCHIYIDESGDYDMACQLVINSKVPRPRACNAVETVLIHKKWAEKYLDAFIEEVEGDVEIQACSRVREKRPDLKPASEADYQHEFFGPKLAIKIVEDIEEAVDHINKYRTPHTETIISENHENVSYFMDHVEANVVCHNASTRLTDGIEFGLGGEIGISTQKVTVGGPIGIYQLMQEKYFLYGQGTLRE